MSILNCEQAYLAKYISLSASVNNVYYYFFNVLVTKTKQLKLQKKFLKILKLNPLCAVQTQTLESIDILILISS